MDPHNPEGLRNCGFRTFLRLTSSFSRNIGVGGN
jgi:hypothetical protein